MTILRGILRVLVGAVFVSAGAGKLAGGESARLAPIVLGETSGLIVIASRVVEEALPLLEILAGLATWAAAGQVARSALAVLLATLVAAGALALPAGVRCGCFGLLGGFEGRPAHLAVAFSLLAATVALAVLERPRSFLT